MKRFLPAANVKQVVLKLSLMAIAATLMVACNRDTKNPTGQAPVLPLTRSRGAKGPWPQRPGPTAPRPAPYGLDMS